MSALPHNGHWLAAWDCPLILRLKCSGNFRCLRAFDRYAPTWKRRPSPSSAALQNARAAKSWRPKSNCRLLCGRAGDTRPDPRVEAITARSRRR